MTARALSIAALSGALLLTGPAAADDHERARRAFERGDIVSLGEVLAAARRDFRGEMLEVELEDEDGRLVYELELLAPGGAVLELLYDAESGELIRARGHDLERARRGDAGVGELDEDDEDD